MSDENSGPSNLVLFFPFCMAKNGCPSFANAKPRAPHAMNQDQRRLEFLLLKGISFGSETRDKLLQ
jgi:hypothetical protein